MGQTVLRETVRLTRLHVRDNVPSGSITAARVMCSLVESLFKGRDG